MNPLQDELKPAPPAAGHAPYYPPHEGRPDYYRDPRLKSPVIATVLSIMPGLGQVYLGYTSLGFLHALVVASLVAFLSANLQMRNSEPLFVIFLMFFLAYNLVDAYRRATLVNEAITRMESPKLPEGLGGLSFGARIFGGVLLILVGTLTLLHLRFGVSMAWLEAWWPAGFILVGVYLLGKAVRDRQSAPDASQS